MKNNKLVEQFFADKRVRYLLIGGSSAFIEFVCFVFLNKILGLIVIANIISFLVGLLYSFLLHRLWTFRGNHKINPKLQFLSYTVLAVMNLIITSNMIFYLNSSLHVPAWIAKLICMVLVVIWNFIILNKLIFKLTPSTD